MSESNSSDSLKLDTSPLQTTEETVSIVSPTKVKKSARFSVRPSTTEDGDGENSRKNSHDFSDIPELPSEQKSHHDTHQKSHHRDEHIFRKKFFFLFYLFIRKFRDQSLTLSIQISAIIKDVN